MSPHQRSRRPAAHKKPTLTHFICLPLVTDSSRLLLENSLREFREVLSPDDHLTRADNGAANNTLRLPTKALRPTGTLHLTLGVMDLRDGRLQGAIQFLESLDVMDMLTNASLEAASVTDTSESATSQLPVSSSKGSRAPPLHISMKGLESMHAPKNTSILYSAPTDLTGRLYPFCVAIRDHFKQHNFLVDDNRELKLHATIVNTIYSKAKRRPQTRQAPQKSSTTNSTITFDSEQDRGDFGGEEADTTRSREGHGPHASSPSKIDATLILERFKDYEWAANIKLDRLAICEMGAKKIFDAQGKAVDERYTEIASIPLPS